MKSYRIDDYKEWGERYYHSEYLDLGKCGLLYHNLDHMMKWTYTYPGWGPILQVLKSINSKNDALLNIRHENERVSTICEYIINGELESNSKEI